MAHEIKTFHYFTNVVVQAAAMNIPRSYIRTRRVPVPWWIDECREAIRARKRALKQFQIHLIQENLVSPRCRSPYHPECEKTFLGGLCLVFIPFNTIGRRLAKATPYVG
jgi:hypothetical protein